MTLYEQILNDDPILKRIEFETLAKQAEIADRTSKQLSNSIGEPKPQMRPQGDHSEIQSTRKVDEFIRKNDIKSREDLERWSLQKREERIAELLKIPEIREAQIEHLKIKEAERKSQEKEKSKSKKTADKAQEKPDHSTNMEKDQKSPEINPDHHSVEHQENVLREKVEAKRKEFLENYQSSISRDRERERSR